MRAGLFGLRSFFVVVWLVASFVKISFSMGIQLKSAQLSSPLFARSILDIHIVARTRNEDPGWPKTRNQEWPHQSLCMSKYVLRNLSFNEKPAKTYTANELRNQLDDRLPMDQDLKLFRRAAGTSSSGSLESERSGSAITVPTTKIYIVPYYRGRLENGAFLPCHWAIFLTPAPNAYGTAYQLRGLPGSFRYPGPERGVIMTHSSRKRQELPIGRLPNTQLREFETVIAQVPISTSKDGYNCQTWTEMVLQRLNQRGWLSQQPSAIVSYLKQLETVLPTIQTRRH